MCGFEVDMYVVLGGGGEQNGNFFRFEKRGDITNYLEDPPPPIALPTGSYSCVYN